MVVLVLLLEAVCVLFGDRQGVSNMLHDQANIVATRTRDSPPPFAVPSLQERRYNLSLSGSFKSNAPSQTRKTRKKTAVVQICLSYHGGYFASVLQVSQALLDFQLEAEHVCVMQNNEERKPLELKEQVVGLRLVRAAGVRIIEFYPEEFHQLHLAKFSPNTNMSNMTGKDFMDLARSKWGGRYDSFIGKLFVFGMEEYEKIIFLDNDVVVLGSLRGLLEWPLRRVPAMAADVAQGTMMNTGVMVLRPDKRLVYEMMQRIAKSEDEPWKCANIFSRTSCDTDQDFINGFFGENIHVLSPYWNILLSYHDSDSMAAGDTGCKREKFFSQEPRSLDGWSLEADSLGRSQDKFHKWLWRDQNRWKRISLLHLAWPKVNWNSWSPMCDNHDDLCPRSFNDEDSLDTCDPVPPPIYTTLIRSGEPGLALLSVYRGFWRKVLQRVERLCQSEFKLMEEFEVSHECMHDPARRHPLGPDREQYKSGANFSEYVYSFIYQEAGWDVFRLLLENPLIPEY